MKILETQSAVLSNYEVLRHLEDVQRRHANHPDYTDKPKAQLRNLHSIATDLTHYLKQPHSPAPAYTPSTITALIKRLAPYNLAKAELLTVLNLRPESTTELEYIVEEAEARYSAEQLEGILGVIEEVLGRKPQEEDNEQGDAMETGGG